MDLKLWKNPITTLSYFGQGCSDYIVEFNYLVSPLIFVLLFFLAFAYNPTIFVAYWVLLGFLSSAGIGFGFHTFVLYVIPAIATFCSENPLISPVETFVGFMPVIYCWGLGSAIGECTSYVAGYLGTEKLDYPRVEAFLKKHSFLLITLSGSIPNNFFDVLGVIAGAIRMPFLKFFAPTLLGKAVIKPTIQLAMTVGLFNKQSQSVVVNTMPSWFRERALTLISLTEGHSYVMTVKDTVIALLVVYFTVNGINSIASSTRLKKCKVSKRADSPRLPQECPLS